MERPSRYHRTPSGTFQCPDCGVIKRTQSNMHYHMKKHEDDPGYPCRTCGRRFLQKSALDAHRATRHAAEVAAEEEEDKKAFHCPVENCTFKTQSKGNGLIHCFRMHCKEELRPYFLPVTDAPGSKEIRCGYCKDTFRSQVAFYYHIKKCLWTMLPIQKREWVTPLL